MSVPWRGVRGVGFLSPLRGWFVFRIVPAAYAAGFILAPLRG
jgi:hypothetical protein